MGRGAEFIVDLPLEEVPVLADHRHQDRDDPTRPPDDRSLVVLIVDDNRDAREMLHAWLEELGHRVYTAADGLEGLALARELHPDVALVDIGLPGLDGYQVAENLRASADGCQMLLVAITGYGRPEDSARAREAGFDAHLVKPVQPETLARLIDNPRSYGYSLVDSALMGQLRLLPCYEVRYGTLDDSRTDPDCRPGGRVSRVGDLLLTERPEGDCRPAQGRGKRRASENDLSDMRNW